MQKYLSSEKMQRVSTLFNRKVNIDEITVIDADEKGKYYITNGHHRVRVWYDNGRENIRARVRSRRKYEHMRRLLKTHNYTHIKELGVVSPEELKNYFKEN